MKYLEQGLVELLIWVVLPLFIFSFLLYQLLGANFFFAVIGFSYSIYFWDRSLKKVKRNSIFRRALERYNFLKGVTALIILIATYFSIIGIFTYTANSFLGEHTTFLFLSLLLTSNFIFFFLVHRHLTVYSYLLLEDNFEINYWFKAPSKKQRHFIQKLLSTKITPQLACISVINRLYNRQHYYSLTNLQRRIFIDFGYNYKKRPSFAQVVFDSVPKLYQHLLDTQKESVANAQIKTLQLSPQFGSYQVQLIQHKYFLPYWFQQYQSNPIHGLFIKNFFDLMNTHLSEYIAYPQNNVLPNSLSLFIQDNSCLKRSEEIKEIFIFEDDSDLQNTLQQTVNYISIAHGIMSNIR